MENLMKQIRVKFTDAEQDNRADHGGSREQKIPIQKNQSFKDKKGQNWFQRQFLRKMSHDYDSIEIEHATALAAAVFAISLREFPEQKINDGPESSFTKTKGKVGSKISLSSQPSSLSKRLSGSFKFSDGQGNKAPMLSITDEKKPEKAPTPVPSMKKTSSERLNAQDTKKPEALAPKRISFDDKKWRNADDTEPDIPKQKIDIPAQPEYSRPMIPPPPPPPPPQQMESTSIKPGPIRPPTPPVNSKRQTSRVSINEAKASAWEREELDKIKQRYEKLKETIDSWESKKKAKARQKLEKKERSDSERKRAKTYEKFQSDMQYINGIVEGARAQAEERRRNEELKVKEKANIIRTTGKVPGTCPCF